MQNFLLSLRWKSIRKLSKYLSSIEYQKYLHDAVRIYICECELYL